MTSGGFVIAVRKKLIGNHILFYFSQVLDVMNRTWIDKDKSQNKDL